MCVHAIPRASTYGHEDEWQMSYEFIRAVVAEMENSGMDYVPDESIDDVVTTLSKMGHVILS